MGLVWLGWGRPSDWRRWRRRPDWRWRGFGQCAILYDVGRGVGRRINGEKANDYAGSSLAGPGDVNGDGHADIAVGASSEVYVLFGPFGNNWQINLNDAAAGIGGYKIVASGSEYIYGSISSAGDVNGDGLGDLLIANYNDPEGGGGYSGAAFVVFGKLTVVRLTWRLPLATAASRSSASMAISTATTMVTGPATRCRSGHLNAHGNADVLIGARWNDEGGYQAGAAYVVWGKADGLKVNLDDVANGVGGYKIVGERGDTTRSDGPGDAAGEWVAWSGRRQRRRRAGHAHRGARTSRLLPGLRQGRQRQGQSRRRCAGNWRLQDQRWCGQFGRFRRGRQWRRAH